jgi:hypothetical protein
MESYTDDLIEASVHDGINVANNTYFYNILGELLDHVPGKIRHISFTGRLIDGAAETTTLTVEGTNDEDFNNANWVTVYGYDSVNHIWVNQIFATNQTTDFAWDFDFWNYKFIRLRIQATAATNTVIIKSRGRT